VTIEGAGGVLINITGGMDLTIDEVTTIASIIQEAAGDNAEIIFGAVHDPALEGDVRVTVIATGLEQEEPLRDNVIRPQFGNRSVTIGSAHASHAAQTAQRAPAAMAAAGSDNGYSRPGPGSPRAADYADALPFTRAPQNPIARQQLTDLDIPTFIRRQMD
jgi:cell division protein FtsZ